MIVSQITKLAEKSFFFHDQVSSFYSHSHFSQAKLPTIAMARPTMPRPPSASFRGSTLSLGDPTRSNRSNPNNVFQERVVVAMVGLPARGKSYLSKTLVSCAARHAGYHTSRRAERRPRSPVVRRDRRNARARSGDTGGRRRPPLRPFLVVGTHKSKKNCVLAAWSACTRPGLSLPLNQYHCLAFHDTPPS